jgi:hypothetical protein
MMPLPTLMILAALTLAVSLSTATADQPTPTCIALVLPSVQGAEGSATDVGNALRELFASFLNGPSIRAVPLEARLPSQAVDEARQKGCSHVLVTTLAVKHPGGWLGKAIGQGVGAASWYTPIPAGGVGAAVARGAAVGGAQVVSSMASNTRAKDEMQLEYRISTVEEVDRAAPKREKAKARTDREDLLTPMVERASTTIVSVVTGK